MRPVERISVTESTVESIKESILSGDYAVGDRLPSEMELSSALNVSRSTVRESIKILQALGFVELKPGRGAFVEKNTESDKDSILNWYERHEDQAADFMDIRVIVETTTVKQAITKSSDKELRKLVKELTYIQDRYESAYKNNDTIKVNYYDTAFHSEIAKATKDELLIAMDDLISKAFTGYRFKILNLKKEKTEIEIEDTHRLIIEGIKNRDVEKCMIEVAKNLEIDNYMRIFKNIRND